MADSDKLWFELGVRDNVSKTLSDIMEKLEEMKEAGKNFTFGMEAIRNAHDIEQALQKIAVAKERISETKAIIKDRGSLDILREMGRRLESIKKTFDKMGEMKGDEGLAKMGTKDMAKFVALQQGLALALDDVKRKTNEMTQAQQADDRAKAAEARRIDTLKDKYYELARIRKQLQDAVMSATPGQDVSSAINMINSLSARMGAVMRAEKSGKDPASTKGADYEEFLRRVKDKTRELTSATDEYNRRLTATQSVQASLKRLELDTSSQRTIAQIHKKTVEFTALEEKLRAIQDLQRRVNTEQVGVANGTITKPTLTRDVISTELDAIQRRYNEALAIGRQREKEDAEAKNQKAAATKKAADAVQMLAHVNQGLVSSYNRIAEAGSNANRISIQFQNQIAGYAGLYGMERLLKSVINVGGQFEYQHKALQNILGDIREANILFGQLQEMAIESPKTFQELTAYAKQLSAYQIPASELYETTKRLADMSSGLGVDMSRLILAYGQVRSAAVLRGQELRQFTEAGIPLVQALADKFTQMNGKLTTTADVFKLISQRAVPFEMVKEIMWDMTNQGGQFYNMQAELTDTLFGKWQKLQDQWQITLGHIASGTSMTGKALKEFLEIAVSLTSAFDTLTPAIGAFATFRLGKSVFNSVQSAFDKRNGSTAIRNMELAKMQQVNRLERERVMYGRQLNAAEQNLVNTKGKLTSQEYFLLAAEKQITAQKAYQLMQEGKMEKSHFFKLLQMQGYTREQRKQIANGNTQILQGEKLLSKNNIMGFLGGWPGIIMTVLGALGSLYTYFEQKNEELSMKGDAMMSHAQQGANTLSKALDSVSADGTMEKKISALEESLLQLGSTGEAVVAKSREHMDDINKRWSVLKTGAENYKSVLEKMGNKAGKALFEKALDDSNIESALKKYDDAVNEMFKQHSGLENFSKIYEKAIASAAKSNEALAKELSGRSLFDQLDIIGYKPLYKELYENKDKYGPLTTSAVKELAAYFKLQKRVKEKWDDITKESIPAMTDELKASAREIGITKFDQLSGEQKQSLETLTREYVNSIENGSVEAKNSLAEELARQAFHINIVGHLSIDSTKMSGFASYIWDKFGGNKLPTESNVNIPMFPWQTAQIGNKDLQKVKIGNVLFTKQQVSNIFEDVDKFAKDYNSQVDDLGKKISRLRKTGASNLVEEAEAERNDLLSVLAALGLREDKKSGGGKNGSGGDTKLEAAKLQLDEIKDFYAEYKKYRDQYGREKALDLVSNIFGMDKDRSKEIVDNYKDVLQNILSTVPQDTTARKRWALTVKKLIGEIDLDSAKVELQRKLEDLRDYMQEYTSKWSLYKTLLNKTGDKSFAMEAFGDGRIFSDMTNTMAQRLREMMEQGRATNTPLLLDWDADEKAAKDYFEKNFENGQVLFDLWKEIVKQTRNEYVDGLKAAADATEKLATIEDKIAKKEAEINELRSKYGANDPRVIVAEDERKKLQAEQFENSEDYLKFYAGILALTVDQAENIGSAIKQNLVDQLANGTINADKFMKSMKNVEQQLSTSRNRKGDLLSLMSGGVKGFYDNRRARAEAEISVDAIRIQKLEEDIKKSREELGEAETKGNKEAILAAKIRIGAAQLEQEEAQKRIKKQREWLGLQEKQVKQLNEFVDVMEFISSAIDGMQQAAQQLSDMFDALGHEGSANTWSDIASVIGIIGSPVKSVTNAAKSAMNGDVGGIIANAVGVLTSPITMAAQFHDKKREKEIEKSTQRLKNLTTAFTNLQGAMEKALGGIYTTGGYTEMYDNLVKQREEVQRQYNLEDDKKKTDKEKLADYQQQMKELDDQIKSYALDMAKSLYDIDLKSWANQLTDAVVSAWEKGEDAVEAYKSKVKEMMKDLTTNILAQKVMERAFDSLGIDDLIAKMMNSSEGKLDETIIPKLAEALNQVGGITADAITKTLDELERKGYVDREEESGSSSASSSIKSITENTADLLASYINAIRADVSVNRMTLTEMLAIMQGQADMPLIAQAQLQQLQMIADNTSRNAFAAEQIYSLLNGNVNKINKFNI